MTHRSRVAAITSLIGLCGVLVACGPNQQGRQPSNLNDSPSASANRSTFFDLFNNRDDPNVTLEVNKYLWTASLDVLGFMPVQSADPFSGLIVFGYGTPPGGSRAYRATVLIDDPALDARSLNVSVQSRSGAVDADTVRAVEDAILTRARQMRIADNDL
ncbi:MAG: DUF3576 domain-containing protein [Rhodobacteraceae bacterium]|nr:DUF3576 domain-containing protein [Paracoccaceae bacterium]